MKMSRSLKLPRKLKKKNMGIEEVKQQMKEYRDYYGWTLNEYDRIDSCNTLEELKEIIDTHISFIESASLDAECGLNRFKQKLGLNLL